LGRGGDSVGITLDVASRGPERTGCGPGKMGVARHSFHGRAPATALIKGGDSAGEISPSGLSWASSAIQVTHAR